MEAARSIGTPVRKQFRWHLLPNLLGPIIVYATLTVPSDPSESFLSFLGIGVQARFPVGATSRRPRADRVEHHPIPLVAPAVPCLMLGVTLLALNFVGGASAVV